MEILVNQEPLDFTLESESSLGEVVDGLSAWLHDGNFAITGINVDTTSYPVGDRSTWESIQLADVSKLNVEALPLWSIDRTTIEALAEYFGILGSCLESDNAEALSDAAAELPYVRARIAAFFPGLADESGDVPVLAFLDAAGAETAVRAHKTDLLEEIRRYQALLSSRIREYDAPGGELSACLTAIGAALPALTEIPVMLQTGKQRTALDAVVALTELLDKAVRLTPLVEDREESPEAAAAVRVAAQALGPFLKELSDALESADTILVGDLLEYEIAPILRTLSGHA